MVARSGSDAGRQPSVAIASKLSAERPLASLKFQIARRASEATKRAPAGHGRQRNRNLSEPKVESGATCA
jgi:hypothetical protein